MTMKRYFPDLIEKKWPHKKLTLRRRLPASRSQGALLRGKQEIGRYFPDLIEKKWQEKWSKDGLYKFKTEKKDSKPSFAKASKGKYYNLVELPYPSGDLHLGHWFAFVPPDAHARYKRMSGYDVFFPNGFDAFGLPAENAAIKRGVHPKDWTMKNIKTMTKQFEAMGTMIDWDYTAITCLPEYYRWNQWIFLKMFEKGLAYRGKALSNWCPSCNTVVANENIETGKCWRCSSEVIQKEVEQWFLKITDYAERLIWSSYAPSDAKAMDGKKASEGKPQSEPASSGKNHKSFVDWPASNASQSDAGWPKQVKDGQNNWIGKSEGLILRFVILSKSEGSSGLKKDSSATPQNDNESIEVFTTRPETTDGATFLVVAPEHPFVTSLLNIKDKISNIKYEEIKEYVEEAKRKTEMERKEDRTKSGIFSGAYVKNPVTGKDIPVWISDYVLAGYGTGAIMAVPFADERDREFAQKFNLPIEKTSFKAKPTGVKKINYHLHDWSISRQRYWGTPVPIIYCKNCARQSRFSDDARSSFPKNQSQARSLSESRLSNSEDNQSHQEPSFGSPQSELPRTTIDGEEYVMIPVPYEDLPIELPYSVDYTPKGKPPLASDEEWLNVKCPKCGGKATRDAETLDTFFDSAWYYYRYTSPNFDKEPFDRLRAKQLLPVDVYFGGSEHTLGHTLYARFFTKFFKDLGLVDFDEFALKRVQHGVILGPDGNRMSKSRGNVVNPDEIVKEYGSDAVRLYLCFMMPYEATAPWSVGAISGIYRFLKRVWELQSAISNQQSAISSEDLNQMHKAIKKVGDDLNNFQFNTAVSALMTWLNFLSGKEQVTKEEYETFLKLLAPFAPYITEEIWQMINSSDNRQSEDPVVSRQSRFSDDARSSFPKSQSQTRSLSESRLSNSEDNQSHQKPSFGSPQSELPPDTSKASRANNLTIQQLSNFNSIHLENWPKFDPKYLLEDEILIVVQVNGKLRETIRIKNQESRIKNKVEEEAKKSEKVQKYLKGQNIKKVIYVEGRLINFVTD